MKMPDLKNWKRHLKIVLLILGAWFALKGLYASYLDHQYNSVREFVEEKESSRTYNRDLLYLEEPDGFPILMVNPAFTKTLFFIEGFRGAVGIAIYREWLETLHREHQVNIVGPIVGLQGWPFEQRNRRWYFQEDMRQVLQIYDAYTATLPANHRIIIASQSFGTLSNATIMAFGKRKPDASVFMSPFNTMIEYKSGGAIVKWLATKRHILQYIMPYMTRRPNPARATLWDIVNNEKNLAVWEHIAGRIICWEESLPSGLEVDRAAEYLENRLLPMITKSSFVIIHGDEDLYLGMPGFENLASILRKSGNTVERIELEETGHMLLFDNGGERAKSIIEGLIDGSYTVK